MAFQFPFNQGADSSQFTPSDVARRRALAERLASNTVKDAGPLGAIANTLSGSLSGFENKQASEAEGRGQSEANALLAKVLANNNPTMATLSEVATNPWLGDRQASVVNALLGQTMQRNDPAYNLDLQLKQAQLDAARNPPPRDPTSSIQNYEYLVSTGIDPKQAQAMSFGAGGTTVNNMGNIPAGYEVVQDPATGATRMQPIAGGPADQAALAALQAEEAGAGRRDLATEIITGAADKARTALNSGGITAGTPGAIAAILPESQAAELRRQIDVMKANATIENLTAMRQASPTGGALGSVTEKEGAMLAAASGAIDPNSSPQQLASAIDNYERTLLQVVHGPAEGERIYQETRRDQGPASGGVIDWTEMDW